ncbi:phosphoenolpyruvate synthase [Candidatus Woesebacteria bacterium]|nr:phosphoenolpyruvate synthase [Candidatus Woesebacteria bacterium]
MKNSKHIVWFEEVDKEDVALVGGKGANLGEMTNAKLPIPYGFIITSNAYFDFIENAKLKDRIRKTLTMINYGNPTELEQASEHIYELITKAPVQKALVNQIVTFYNDLSTKETKYFKKHNSFFREAVNRVKSVYEDPLVAVRSSATAEDLPDASFAGQQETYLNVKGEHHLLQKVKECWASLFTARAIYYRKEKGFDHFQVGLAAVVQRMIQSQKSGIAFSVDPVTNDKNKIVIEAVYGLGEYIVQGKVTPDHYEVDKRSFVIIKKQTAYQTSKYVHSGVSNREVKLNKKEGSSQKLSENEIRRVALLVSDIEKHYFFPQDIEWAIEKGEVFITQSRPITTIDTSNNHDEEYGKLQQKPLLVSGSPASPGIGVGTPNVILSPKEISKIKQGDILVAPQTNPDYVPAMKKATAIVTEKGGRTSHAAIVSRELGIPAVVGADKATKILKNEKLVSVNGRTGEVFKGSIISAEQKQKMQQKKEAPKERVKTVTKVYVNLAEPDIADEIAKRDIDGLGLLRAEFMISGIGVHPKEFIKRGEQKLFIRKLSEGLKKFAKAFEPRPVVYRATDFKTNEYRNLKGGALYEPKEENPMLGYRGASRYIADADVFLMELEAIRNVRDAGFNNLHLMIPFVRVPWELIRIKDIVRDFGLYSYPDFKLWIMVEVPSAALMLQEFIDVGIDGVSIGTNDLTMMLLGVDRDSAEVAQIYDERNPAVVSTLEHIVETCNEAGITCSICGQAASDYPEIVEALVKRGITSVSITPDAIERTRALIYSIEKKLNKK